MQERPDPKAPRLLCRVIAAFLVVWIFLLSLAGVSPALHEQLHADTDCASQCARTEPKAPIPGDHPAQPSEDGHYCGVIALQSADVVTDLATLVQVSPRALDYLGSITARLTAHAYRTPLQARAPPFEIEV